MPGTTSVGRSFNQDLDGLLSGIKWGVNNLTYSFPTSKNFYGPNGDGTGYSSANEPLNNFQPLNATQQAVVRSVLAMYGSIANVTFTEITETATTHATLHFGNSSAPGTAWAYYPFSGEVGGDVWFGPAFSNPVKGSYAYHGFIHEFGHALGLKHGQETDVYGAMTVPHDSMEYSVMTYFSYVGDTGQGYANETWGFAQTLMMYDIAALQYMYGANFNTNSGNTTYSWSPTTGAMSINGVGQGAAGGNRIFMTVWDGGGVDTYDFSSYATNLTVDLRPGNWTTTSSAQLAHLDFYTGNTHIAAGNIANALQYNNDPRSLIENAIGGSGNDIITGNDADNVLTGNAGNDTLNGGNGNDTLDGGIGADLLTGASGDDAFIFKTGYGADTITDFVAGYSHIDEIDLTGLSGITSFSAVLPLLSQVGADTVINFGGGDTLTLKNMDKTSLTADDFLFNVSLTSSFVGAYDFDGDGKDDILWPRDSDGAVQVWLMNGLQIKQQADLTSLGTAWKVDTVGDFDGDGKGDILWRNKNDGSITIWEMNGFQIKAQGSLTGLDNTWHVQGAGDINGDGKDDILWRHDNDGAILFWEMNGLQVQSQANWGAVDTGWKVGAFADLDGDGKKDILWRHDNGSNYIWELDGLQVKAGGFAPYVDPTWHVQGTGDINGDVKSDILWRHDNDGAILFWLMNGLQPQSQANWGAVDTGWRVGTIADVNGDAKSDILWRHDDGSNYIWELAGLQVNAGGFAPHVDPTWHIA